MFTFIIKANYFFYNITIIIHWQYKIRGMYNLREKDINRAHLYLLYVVGREK
jgi:hypothetical protein